MQGLLITVATLKPEYTRRWCSVTQQRIDGANHARQQPVGVFCLENHLVLRQNRIQLHQLQIPDQLIHRCQRVLLDFWDELGVDLGGFLSTQGFRHDPEHCYLLDMQREVRFYCHYFHKLSSN